MNWNLLPQSLRWRLQLWLGFLLTLVLIGFGFTAWELHRSHRLGQIDLELESRVAEVSGDYRRGPHFAPMVPPVSSDERQRTPPMFRGNSGSEVWWHQLAHALRGNPEGEMRPGHRSVELSPAMLARFDGSDPAGWYFIIWSREGNRLKASTNAPTDLTRPRRVGTDTSPHLRSRGELREAYHFTEMGDSNRDHEADQAHVAMFLACAEFNAGANHQARKTAEAAWSILTRIVAGDRGTFIEDFFATADILSLVAACQGDHARVRQVRGEAGRILRDLARMYPAQFGFRCIWTWVNWASQAIQASDYPEALKLSKAAVQECIAIQRKLRRTDDEVLGVAQFNLAVSYYGLKKRRAAFRAGLAAEGAFLRLPEDNERRSDLLPQVRELLEASSRVPVIRVRTKVVESTGGQKSDRG